MGRLYPENSQTNQSTGRLYEVPAETKGPGFIQGVIQSAASPFLRFAAPLADIGGTVVGAAAIGVGKLIGSKRLAQAGEKTLQRPVTKDFGYFGKARPVGFDEQGKPLSTSRFVAEAGGVGAQIAANLFTGSCSPTPT